MSSVARKKTYKKPVRKPKARAPRKTTLATRPSAPPKDISAGDVGSNIGRWVGTRLGDLVSHITGFGDYEIEGNSIMNGGMSPLQVQNSMDRGGYIVRHREYICDIMATTAFTNQEFDLNPGLVTTFPWLAGIAQNFEEYAFRGLIFEFKSMSSDAVLSSSTSSALGSVIMATQYNTLSPKFTSKVAMENFQFACSNKPSQTFIHPVECKKSWTPVTQLYVRNGLQAVYSGDQRLYDLGTFNIATVGCQAAGGVLGELWASFEIELFKPKFSFNDLTSHLWLGGVTNTFPFGTAVVRPADQTGSSLGGTINAAGDTFLFPPNLAGGMYFISYTCTGGSVTITGPSHALTNCQFVNFWRGPVPEIIHTPNGVIAERFMENYVVRITGPNASIRMVAGGSLPSSVHTADLWITQISDQLTS